MSKFFLFGLGVLLIYIGTTQRTLPFWNALAGRTQ